MTPKLEDPQRQLCAVNHDADGLTVDLSRESLPRSQIFAGGIAIGGGAGGQVVVLVEVADQDDRVEMPASGARLGNRRRRTGNRARRVARADVTCALDL